MIGVNKVILIGNLGKNPEIITFPKEGRREDEMGSVVKKATFPLATTEVHKNRDGERVEQTDWHTVVCWRGLADIAEKLLRKGTQVYVEGKLQSRTWDDRDGNKHYAQTASLENFDPIQQPKQEAPQEAAPENTAEKMEQKAEQVAAEPEAKVEGEGSDLPF